MDQHRSAEADDELRQEQLEDEHDSEPGSFGEFLRAHWISASVAALVLIAAVAAGIIWWLHARHFEWTDDAFIDLRQFAVSSRFQVASGTSTSPTIERWRPATFSYRSTTAIIAPL